MDWLYELLQRVGGPVFAGLIVLEIVAVYIVWKAARSFSARDEAIRALAEELRRQGAAINKHERECKGERKQTRKKFSRVFSGIEDNKASSAEANGKLDALLLIFRDRGVT